jgi:hypothetical protein
LVETGKRTGTTKTERLHILEDLLSGVRDTLEPGPEGDGIENEDRELFEREALVLEGWISMMKGDRSIEPPSAELSDRLDILENEAGFWTRIIDQEENLSAEKRQDLIDTRDELVRWRKELKTMKKVKGSRGAGPTISRRPSRKR